MHHSIDRIALADFVARQVELIERTPVPSAIVELAGEAGPAAGLTAAELRGVWLGSGLAAQVGLALMEHPERFVTTEPVLAVLG